MAFTFDDALGENVSAFAKILDFLEVEHVLATFFVIADDHTLGEGRPSVLRDAWRRGHELGNHGLRNAQMARMSREEFAGAVDQWESSIKGALGQPWPRPSMWRWFRPPQGVMSPNMDAELTERGYHVALGDLYSDDWAYADERFHAGIIKAAAQDGSIAILHVMDGERAMRTLEILQDVVPALRTRGFQFVGLSELFQTAEGSAPVCAECPHCVELLAVSIVGILSVLFFLISRATARRVGMSASHGKALLGRTSRLFTKLPEKLAGQSIELARYKPFVDDSPTTVEPSAVAAGDGLVERLL